MLNERDLCVRKDFKSGRNEKRIPIICNLIEQLWENYRAYDETIGFYYMTNLLEVESKKDYKNGSKDPYFWEEDEWYDKLQKMIQYSTKFETKYKLTSADKEAMKQIVKYFETYWELYGDLRLQQIITLFDESFEEQIRSYNLLGRDFWKEFFVPQQIKTLEGSIQGLKDTKQEIIDGATSLFDDGLVGENINDLKNIYITKLDKLIEKSSNKLEQLKKEYDI